MELDLSGASVPSHCSLSSVASAIPGVFCGCDLALVLAFGWRQVASTPRGTGTQRWVRCLLQSPCELLLWVSECPYQQDHLGG